MKICTTDVSSSLKNVKHTCLSSTTRKNAQQWIEQEQEHYTQTVEEKWS